MNHLVLILLLIVVSFQPAWSSSKIFGATTYHASPAPKMGPIAVPKPTKTDVYIEKFASRMAPSVISNIAGGGMGTLIKISEAVDEYDKKKAAKANRDD